MIDLNCDMGESFGAYKMGTDEEILNYITSANIACGFHAGDPTTMRKNSDDGFRTQCRDWRSSWFARFSRLR